MKIIILFGCSILLLLWGTLVQSAECKNPFLHRNQLPTAAIFLELFSLGFTEDIDYYSSEDISLLIGWQFSG